MNIPQMLSHRGSETHMYVINNARDLRLKMTTGHSYEPRDGRSHGLVLLQGTVGEGLGGPAPIPGPVPGAAWGGCAPSGVPAPKCPLAPHGAALAVSGRQRMLQGALTAVGAQGGDGARERDAGMPWKAQPGSSQQAHPRRVPVGGGYGSQPLCLSSRSCP